MKRYKDLLWRLIPILLVLILTIGLSQIFFRGMIRSETDKSWEELFMCRDNVAREISIRLKNNMDMLDLAADAIVMNADFEDEETVLSYLTGVQEITFFDRIDVVFSNGTILVQNGDHVEDTGRRTFDELIAKGSHISRRVTDFHTGKEALHIFSPVDNENGEPIAILGATLFCSTMEELFTSYHYGDDACLFLMDVRDGDFVLDQWHEELGNVYEMGSRELAEEYRDFDFVADIMQGNTGSVALVSGTNGKDSYMAYTKVADTDFVLAIVVQDDTVFASVDELSTIVMWVGIIEAVLLLLLSVWIYYIMRKSMQNETRAKEAELALMHQKEAELQSQYEMVADRQSFLETLAANLPGGYHRCTTDYSFRLTFISNSFTEVTGYTMEQIQKELNGSYMGIVAPKDREYFLSLAPNLEKDGAIHCAYRIRRRDGAIRWVKDSTQHVERAGEKYYQCALTDITEQIEDLERARQEAEASSQAKSTFLFNISHDIRTPMNAIKGFTRMIQDNSGNQRAVTDAANKIAQASDSLMLLMNDILDISRIERGKEDLNLQPMDLYEHGKNLYEMFAAEMAAAGITFLAEGENLHDHVYCDELKLTRIMMNMLSNARKFTPAGGKVVFGGTRLQRDEKSCTYRFFVRDTGIGMSPEFQKRAFEQFERERTSTESGVTGSGLGLAIIKMLVDLMKGQVEIWSEQGKGTEISVTLTLRLADEEQIRQAKPEAQEVPDMSGIRVLLVEDNDFNREIARYVLEGIQLQVEEAANGAICLEKLMSVPAGYYDLILMDIQMPVMDGYTATVEIRHLPDKGKAGIPIVAMTANAFEEDRKRCLDAGMNGHLGKPIDPAVLLNEITKILSE